MTAWGTFYGDVGFFPWYFFKGSQKGDRIMFTFWKKNESGLPGPKELPSPVGREIIAKHRGNPDEIWNLKSVARPKEGCKDTFEIRVFDAEQAGSKKIAVKDYNSLTEHPELILYDGWYDKKAEAEIKKRS